MNANEAINIQDLEVDLAAFHRLPLSKAFNLQGHVHYLMSTRAYHYSWLAHNEQRSEIT